ncbi:MAG: hypothetical protein JSS66_03090 [Armatimonadetes bacterium]|nr:hypothetical protein [Armatimonadota bacterium]
MIAKTGLLAVLAAFATTGWADLSHQTAPPKAGEPYVWPGAWKNTKNLVKAERGLTVSTDNPARFFPGPLNTPNEEFENQVPNAKMHAPIPTNPPDQSANMIQANSLIQDFEGRDQTIYTPPDDDMATGDQYIVQVVNSTWRILDKAGNNLYESTINNFIGDNGFLFDPKVFFDPWRGRWSMLWHRKDAGAHTAHLITVSSDDSNPFGTWYVWYFGVSDGGTRWCDYADWAYGQNGLFASGNELDWSDNYLQARFFIFNPSEIYSNGGASYSWFNRTQNPDGSQAFAPRACKMNYSGNGGCWFLNGRWLGGSKLTIWSLTDPLGSPSLTAIDTNVSAYAIPPNATDPGGGSIATNACRLMPCIYTFDPTANKLRVFTSLNAQNPSEPANCAARLYVVDPSSGAVELDWNFWATGTSTWFACPSANYDGSNNWVFSRSGSGLQVQARYVNFDASSFSNSSAALKSSSVNTGGRWGDYHGGNMDWGDYRAGNTSQQMWFTGEWAKPGGWGTWMGSTLTSGRSAGSMTVTAGNMAFTGYEGGPFSPNGGYNYTVGNSGNVQYTADMSGPSWLTIPAGTFPVNNAGVVINLDTNATANGLGYGHYAGNVNFTNTYTGGAGSTSRSATLDIWAVRHPTSFTIRTGRLSSGNVGSLTSVDGNALRVCKFIVPNVQTPPVQVELDGTAPGATSTQMYFRTYVKMSVSGAFQQRMEMFNWNTNNWDATDFRVDNLSTAYQLFTLVTSGNENRYIGAANAVRSKYSIRQVGPAASSNWCVDQDYIDWIFVP